jgi:hypothetical protein
MKDFNLSKIVGASVLAASIAILPLSLPVSAQTNTQPNTTTEDKTSPTFDTTPFQETRNDNNNWGWLGLIGLIGLANLFRKPKEHVR